MATIYFNGKFAAQTTTGVQRVARQLVLALDERLAARAGDAAPPEDWVLLLPPGSPLLPLGRIAQRHVGRPGRPLHVWEQMALPWAARGGLLVSLAGSAPYFARRQAAMLHDAAVFDHPEAYTRAFVAWYRQLFRHLGRNAELLLTVSEFSRQRLAMHLHVPPERFTVVPNGCDHLDAVEADENVLDRHGLRGARFLLAVGSANPTKNLAALLQAYTRLPPGDGLRLVIVGGLNPRVFAGAADAGDPAGVVRTGPLDDSRLKALYAAAAALVFPSTYEGFGIPPLEAMACGCPVLAARAASIPEVCGDGVLYFEPTQSASLDAALLRVATDAAFLEQLRLAGRSRVSRFRWAVSAQHLHDSVRSRPSYGGAA